MIIINVGDKSLDLYEDMEISWSWTSFRFADKLSDQYTNNFNIPKTDNNIKILGIYSLLDYPNVQFGEKIEPATLILNGVAIDIFIRITNITENEIEISVFEDGFSSLDKNKLVNDYLVDDHTSILEWNMWSMTNYPNKFVSYNYGMPYYWDLAQRHPYLRLKEDIIDKIDLHGYSIKNWNYNWNILCTKKVVCPQNITQVLEYTNYDGTQEEGGLLNVYGGQHICNDVNGEPTSSITYNRDCYVQMKIWYGWSQNNISTIPNVYVKVNGQTRKIIDPHNGGYVTSWTYSWGLGTENVSIQMHKGDVLTFYCDEMNKFNRSFSMVVKLTTSAYEITDDDYNTELLYKSRLPYVKVKSPSSSTITTYTMNGTTYSTVIGDFQTERLSFSYYGQYCNIPQIKLGDLFYSLQWLIGGKLKENKYPKEIYFNTNEICYPKNNRSEEKYIKEINNINPTSTKLGQKNYIKYTDDENPTPITTINNSWLEYEKTFHEIIFHHFTDNVIKQYEIELADEIKSINDIKVNFTTIENPVIFNYNNRVEPIPVKYFDMNNLWYSNEVEMTFYGTPIDFRNYDTLFVDGRTYYVIDGEIDLNNNISKINSVLVQWDVPLIQITNIYSGENDGDVYLEVNISSLLPLKDAYIEYQQGLNISTLKKQQLQLQTGIQTVKITGLEPRTYIFTPTVQNVQSINRGNSRNYIVRWLLPYVNIIELKKISSTEVSCKVEVISQAALTNVEDSFYSIGNPGVKRHSGKLLPTNGIQTFTYGLHTDTWYCYVEATNVNGTTKSTTKQITL